MSLCAIAEKAFCAKEAVSLDPKIVRQVAESWHEDKEKIRYLESLLVRMGRG